MFILLTHQTAFSDTQNPASNNNVRWSWGNDTWIKVKCIGPDGSLVNAHDMNDDKSWIPGQIGISANRIMNTTVNPNERLDWAINSCDNESNHQQNLELDPEGTMDVFSDLFGFGQERVDNLKLFSDAKTKRGAYKFLFVYGTGVDKSGKPTALRIKRDDQHYALFGLGDDTNKIITDESLSDVSNLMINQKITLNEARIASNVDDLVNSKSTIKKALVMQQVHGLNQLIALYANNTENAKNWLVGLKGIGKYEDLNTQAKTIANFLNSATIGSANLDKTKLQDIDKMNIAFSETINKLRLTKDKINSLFVQMNTVANAIPGQAPTTIDDMVKDPKKYTIIFRLISDALDNDQNAIKIFYALDDWIAKSQSFTYRINQLKGVKGNFLPKVNGQISTIIKSLDAVKTTRINFEKSLKTSIAAGKGDVNNEVHVAYDKLRQSIANLGKMNTDLQTLIDSAKTIEDPQFKASLETEKARLTPVATEITALLAYSEKEMPQAMSAAYETGQNKANQPINATIADATTHIAQLEAALKPTIDKLNANQDANQTYAAAKGQITAAIDFLMGDQTKLQKLATTVADPQLKTVITTTLSNIDLEKARITQIEQAVSGSMMNDHIAKADAIKASVTLATGDFKKAYNQYVADKRTGNPSTANVMQEYNKIYNTLQQVVPLLKTDLATMAATDKRKPAVTAYVGPKTVGSSLAYMVQSAANLLINLGIQVPQPT